MDCTTKHGLICVEFPRFCGRVTIWDSGGFLGPPFEVYGGQVSERRVPSVGIVEALDVFEQGDFGFGPVGKSPSNKPLAFEAGEEALAQGVVVAVAHRAHGRSDASLPASLAEGHGGIL